MTEKNLQKIIDTQPSVSGSTFLVSALFVISWLLMVGLFILSIGLFLESFLHYKIFLDWVSRQLSFGLNEDQRWKIATSFGLFSLFLSIIFLGVIFLCKMVLRRNHFIIQIEDWIFDNVKEIKKPRPPKRNS
ncbi:hypothetical protein [Kaistella jeonii]|uniref:Transmembrane protein n=1 Tax=Kaistella jeonii TaxID=266749 RepID=A0A0C1D9B9_9FLAO|nr:hypothetical protein [Kaistella jeonii]KIA90470.1 hypothetical protein OA86_00800 [Kaistella jeonii]SFB72391.1 hypothetical protein SAMN05421876_101373 [Kaistella jeonii]VEI94963.1 Uncharacterised protein [Kaistella jeonii]